MYYYILLYLNKKYVFKFVAKTYHLYTFTHICMQLFLFFLEQSSFWFLTHHYWENLFFWNFAWIYCTTTTNEMHIKTSSQLILSD